MNNTEIIQVTKKMIKMQVPTNAIATSIKMVINNNPTQKQLLELLKFTRYDKSLQGTYNSLIMDMIDCKEDAIESYKQNYNL